MRPSHGVRRACDRLPATLAPTQGELTERFTCVALVNGKDGKTVFDIGATAQVATPLLDMSARALTFHYQYAKGQPLAPIRQTLTIRNVSKLPLSCALRCPPPFTIDKPHLQLALFEGATLNVAFDPTCKGDLQSGVAKQKLQITYSDNPQVSRSRGAAAARGGRPSCG